MKADGKTQAEAVREILALGVQAKRIECQKIAKRQRALPQGGRLSDSPRRSISHVL